MGEARPNGLRSFLPFRVMPQMAGGTGACRECYQWNVQAAGYMLDGASGDMGSNPVSAPTASRLCTRQLHPSAPAGFSHQCDGVTVPTCVSHQMMGVPQETMAHYLWIGCKWSYGHLPIFSQNLYFLPLLLLNPEAEVHVTLRKSKHAEAWSLTQGPTWLIWPHK